MSLHSTSRRVRRYCRRLWTQISGGIVGFVEGIDKEVFGRLGRASRIWRFLVIWTVAFVAVAGGLTYQWSQLKKTYEVLRPTPGGIFSEGNLGTFTTANPLYAVSDVDTSVSRLLFSSLLGYDKDNVLTGNLADRWSVNENGTIYTVHLRPRLLWHDGVALDAQDVVFTYHTIQNPDAQSPLLTSWQGVKVEAVDDRTVTFTLPNPLSSFPHSLTNGIIPKHILGKLAAADLRSAAFNTANPIGSGPFIWGSIGLSGVGDTAEEQIIFKPFKQYWAGAPKLDRFNIFAYARQSSLIAAYKNKEITAIAGMSKLPKEIVSDKTSTVYNLPLTAGTYVFFKTTDPLLKDIHVRQALALGSDRTEILNRLGYSAVPVDEPFLRGELGYDPAFAQATGQMAEAKTMLDDDGWKVGAGGWRYQNGQQLTLSLTALDNGEYASVADQLRQEWSALGVNVQVSLLQPDVLRDVLSRHSYQAILDGIAIGTDPDVFVYWDSTQADIRSPNRLNFSEYSSGIADAALEAGRTRLNGQLRTIKYRAFLQAWQTDTPALGLYQPRQLYVSHIPVYGLNTHQINNDADRFDNVNNWMVHVGWILP